MKPVRTGQKPSHPAPHRETQGNGSFIPIETLPPRFSRYIAERCGADEPLAERLTGAFQRDVLGNLNCAGRKLAAARDTGHRKKILGWLADELRGFLCEVTGIAWHKRTFAEALTRDFSEWGEIEWHAGREFETVHVGEYDYLADMYVGVFVKNPQAQAQITGDFWSVVEGEFKAQGHPSGWREQFRRRDQEYWKRGGLLLHGDNGSTTRWQFRPKVERYQWLVTGGKPPKNLPEVPAPYQRHFFNASGIDLGGVAREIILQAVPQYC